MVVPPLLPMGRRHVPPRCPSCGALLPDETTWRALLLTLFGVVVFVVVFVFVVASVTQWADPTCGVWPKPCPPQTLHGVMIANLKWFWMMLHRL